MMQDIIDWLSDNIGGIIKKSKNEIISEWDFPFFKLTIITNIHTLKSSFDIKETPSYFDKELFDKEFDDSWGEVENVQNDSTYGDYGFDSKAAQDDFFGVDDSDQNYDDYD